MMQIFSVISLIIMGLAASPFAHGKETLPLPRFASLRSGEVNVRVGPGKHYPIEWTFTRAQMPVEITAEFYTWRKIRDWQGSGGWVHQSMLSGNRMGIILEKEVICHEDANPQSTPIVRLAPQVIVKLLKTSGNSCRIQVEGHKCWLPKDKLWGVYEKESIK